MLAREAQIGEGDGIEVVVGEGDEAKTEAAQSDDFVDDVLEFALAGFLSVGAPDAAKGAVLGAAANGLHGGPHIFCGIHQVPAGGEEFAAFNAAAFVDFFGRAGDASGDDFGPGKIAVAFDDGVGLAALERFFRKQRGVNAAIDDPCAAGASHAADRVSAQGVAGVDADADDVAGMNGLGDDLLEGFIDEDGIADGTAASRLQGRRASAA